MFSKRSDDFDSVPTTKENFVLDNRYTIEKNDGIREEAWAALYPRERSVLCNSRLLFIKQRLNKIQY